MSFEEPQHRKEIPRPPHKAKDIPQHKSAPETSYHGGGNNQQQDRIFSSPHILMTHIRTPGFSMHMVYE